MPLLPSFAQAIFHDLPRNFDPRNPWSRHSVFGLRLRPFCLWHLALLQQADSPLLEPLHKDGPAKPPTPRDLTRAVRICRLRFPQIDMSDGIDLRVLWAMTSGFQAQLAAFSEYIADFQCVPEYSIVPPEQSGKGPAPIPRGAPPAILCIVRDTIALARCSRQEAWEMPVGEARWWHALAENSRHECDFMTQEKHETQARIKAEQPELWARLRAAAEEYKKTHGG